MKSKIKICFVGIHHKTNMEALDSRTKSGQLIDAIIARLGDGFEVGKRNLFPTEYLPKGEEAKRLTTAFKLDHNTFYILLGKLVSEVLSIDLQSQCITVYHPGYVLRRGKVFREDYINTIVAILRNNASL